MNVPPMILNRASVEKGACLQSLIKFPADEPSTNSPARPPWRVMSIPRALLPISFWIPRKGSPNRAPAERDAPTPEPSNYLLKSPVNGPPPPGFPMGPYGERHPSPELSSTHSLVIHLTLEVPGK